MLKYTKAGLDDVFRALADPTRRGIVERLCRRPESVSEIARPLKMSLPAVMQHLQVLEDCGLVRSHKSGRTRMCEVDATRLGMAEQWLTQRRQFWNRQFDQLGELIDTTIKGRHTDRKKRS